LIGEFAAGCWFCPGTTLMIRRDTFLALGGFDDKLLRLEDYEFFLSFGLAGGYLFVLPESLSHIHVQSVPRIHRVEYATDYVLDKYAQSHAVDRRALRYIAAFCRLVKASTYYRHRMAFSALWNLAAAGSWFRANPSI
jgi:hypothetical protein